jgi:uncharacterized protein
MKNDDLIVYLAMFAAMLRAHGVEVGIGDELDATTAFTLTDLFDKEEVRRVLHITLKIQPPDRPVFDRLFAAFWVDQVESATRMPAADPRARAGARPRPNVQHTTAMVDPHPSGTPAENASIGYSPDVVLRRKPFEACSDRDFAEMERLLARLVPRWTARRSRRLTPVRGRGVPDFRRSFRRAIGTGGEMLSLARRARAIDAPRVVVLCDTSGSMDAHVRFLLAFVMAFKRIARRTEVFAFNTSLVRLTPWLEPSRVGRTLERIASGVPGWSGGTRIGESLAEFVAKYMDDVVSKKSVVVILSDGLDRGDTSGIADAMRSLRSKARKILWLNPLSGDPRYEPTARAMQAALPFIDRLAPAHNLESLERILPELAA